VIAHPQSHRRPALKPGVWRRALALGAALAAAFVVPVPAAAQDWPARPIRLVAPFSPGGSADTLGRLIAQALSDALRQNVVVENRAGAGGVIGSELVAKSAPDGYTLVVSGIASHVIAPAIGKVPFDPVAGFTHIALLGGPPIALVVHPDVPARDVREFVAWARTQDAGVSYGSPGNGTHGHLMGELLARETGIRLVHVSYKGAAPAMTDLLAKQIPASSTTFTTASSHVRAGKLRALAVTAKQRLADTPDVPTFVEAGFPQLVGTTWFSISGPPGMPPAIAQRLNGEIRAALRQPKLRERMQFDGIEPGAELDPQQFTDFVRAEIDRWGPLARQVRPGDAR
jgi:tripartite-type tricarboxylate transporter receptor subunit TctC